MKAAVYDRYGSLPEIREVQKPVPGDSDVLVKVHAASVNSWDWDEIQGRLARKNSPPRHPILGADVAGVVEAVGGKVGRFKPGDAVFGDISEAGWGGFAEYVKADEKFLALKPDRMSFEQAAATPQAGLLALQSFRKRPIAPGEAVLINGAGGGVGTFAIQMAKRKGAVVTGVDRAEKLDFMREVGADQVIDFAREDFAAGARRYDFVLDVNANRSMFAHARVLKPGGRYVIVGGGMATIFATVTLGAAISVVSSRRIGLLLYRPNAEDLEEMKRLFAADGIAPVIDTVYPLEQTADALRHVGEGRAKGKVVVTIPVLRRGSSRST